MKERLTPEKFLTVARELPVNERTPYAFEKRIMARIAHAPVDTVSEWAHVLWRAVAPCVGIMLVAAAASFAAMSGDTTPDESPDLEATVFAPTQVAFDVSR